MTKLSPWPESVQTLLDELLAEQQRLQTPVARYSAAHDRIAAVPAMEPVYRDLIPLSVPQAGEQYAFEVDLDACSGCKACVAGCHSLNGLDETETWRDVGLMAGGSSELPFHQTITSACHHCADPGCLNGCPVLAYEKDPITGIVRHLDDQCIGCSYCILKCPYDVPKYSKRLGIVRKCDMCHGRLAEGEAPACVQACPTHAIRIVKVTVEATPAGPRFDTSAFLPGAPDPELTQPTTRYLSRRGLPLNLAPVQPSVARPESAHTPLALMLTFTQVAVGLHLAGLVAPAGGLAFPTAMGAWLFAAVGLAASFFHLGQPLRAWRIFLGLRRSWLSREAVVFGAWFAGATALLLPWPIPGVATITGGLGLLGVACSAMIYIDTGRSSWRTRSTAARFGGTTFAAAALAVSPMLAGAVVSLKLAYELIEYLRSPSRSKRLVNGSLRRWWVGRYWSGCGGAILLLGASEFGPGATICGVALSLMGEVIERSLFFRMVTPSRMPGAYSS
jgi:formate dehydrogenase iron-sulfur subunit